VLRTLVRAIDNDERLSRLVRYGVMGALGVCSVSGLGLVERALEVWDRAALIKDDTFCDVRGRRVRYRLLGAGRTGPRVVLVNGLTGSLEQWRLVQDALAQEAPVLAYDRGGTGFSDPMAPNDAEAQAEELAGLLHSLGLAPPFVIATYSASALLARLFALRHPDLVQGIVFLDPILPDYGYIAPRIFLSRLVQSFFGVLRLKASSHYGGPPVTLAEQKEQAIFARYPHWRATAEDGIRLGNWESRLMGLPRFGDVRVGVLCTFDEQLDYEKGAVTRNRAFAGQAAHGRFFAVRVEHGPVEHSKLVTSPAGAEIVVEFIRRISQDVRPMARHA
jgi:pimeloyl-ACP methyl ester carboxylesterase